MVRSRPEIENGSITELQLPASVAQSEDHYSLFIFYLLAMNKKLAFQKGNNSKHHC